jgi:hypothetical protein
MRNVIYAALLVATPAAAQPVTQPKACQVTIARAPDDVRAVVETWVKSEAQCSVALEVRIVPTEGGLYLLAQDERGRVRERIVPDAQTAGVLVASWIADDNAPIPPLPPPAPEISAPEPPMSAPVASQESLTPPGMAPIALTTTAPPTARRSKWLTVGGLVPMADGAGAGLRLEVDVIRRGNWMFGAALSGADGSMNLRSTYGEGYLEAEDYKFIAYVARPSLRGRWQLRPALGVGLIHSEGVAYDGNTMFYDLSGTFPTAEASFMVSRDLGASWAAYAGPLATLIAQEFTSYSAGATYPMHVARGNVDLVLFAGVRHRL